MNEMAVTVHNIPWTHSPQHLSGAPESISSISRTRTSHISAFSAIFAKNLEGAKRRYITWQRFRQLLPKFCMEGFNHGPFKLFCDDLQPSNMLADPETLKVTEILGWEFTHAIPAQFFYPPWGLILKEPDFWLENYSMEEFFKRYEPRFEQFLKTMERVEARVLQKDVRLSMRMRESWGSGRFWFDYGISKSMDVDDIYWDVLHREGDDVLDDEGHRAMQRFAEGKMQDLKAYDKGCKNKVL